MRTTLSILWQSPAMELASSRPDDTSMRLANSGLFGRHRAKIPKASRFQGENSP